MSRWLSSLLLVLSLTSSLDALPRRRAVRFPTVPVPDSPVAAWLIPHARVLSTTELVPDSADLDPLANMIGDATIAGLGEGTHGSHEIFTMKLRVADFLVRKMSFDLLAFEGPFPQFEQLDAYVQGGAGDPRAILFDVGWRYRYFFWDVEEVLAVVEWMREYNLHRGERPAVHITGADVYGQVEAWKAVVAYLRTVDPAAAAQAETDYACVGESIVSSSCRTQAAEVFAALAPREAELAAKSSSAAFHTALHHARIVVQTQNNGFNNREIFMADNLLWMRQHRSATGRVMYWAHNEHVTKGPPMIGPAQKATGQLLAERIGTSYFALGTLTSTGTYAVWDQIGNTQVWERKVMEFPALTPDMSESEFQEHPASLLLIGLRGAVPAWLSAPAPANSVGTSGLPNLRTGSLPLRFDAVIWIEQTTPSQPIQR